MKADLHSHTVLSDGALNVDQLISQAKRVGLDYIAVTDHNSTHSIPAVLALGKELGIRQTATCVDRSFWVSLNLEPEEKSSWWSSPIGVPVYPREARTCIICTSYRVVLSRAASKSCSFVIG